MNISLCGERLRQCEDGSGMGEFVENACCRALFFLFPIWWIVDKMYVEAAGLLNFWTQYSLNSQLYHDPEQCSPLHQHGACHKNTMYVVVDDGNCAANLPGGD